MGNDTALTTSTTTGTTTRVATAPAGHASHAVSGELDLAAVHGLRRGFHAALHRSERPVGGLDLDLTGVTFMDAAGLGAVLWCRAHALSAGVDFVVDAASPAATRLMRLTGTHDLLRGVATVRDPAAVPA